MRNYLAILFLVACFAGGISSVEAQTSPQFFVTWEAERGYVPSHYEGKILPPPQTPIFIAFELIEGGKRLDLSSEDVFWYLNGKLLKSDEGNRSAVITAGRTPGIVQSVRIQINNFRDTGTILSKTIEIPTAVPEVVVENPFPNNVLFAKNFKLCGFPYFYDIRKLEEVRFTWDVNGQEPTNIESPEFFDVNILDATPGSKISVSLNIASQNSIFESITKILNLTFGTL